MKVFWTMENVFSLGEVALMFLKMYTGMSCPKLMEQLNGNIHYQMFCDVIIDPTRPLTNYKLLDDIMLELAGKLKIQQLQDILAEQWKPYMQNLDTMYTDATCYESEMRYPTDPKLLWEGIEKSYETMCELSKRLRIHRPRTKFIDMQKANLAYRKQRKHSKSQTRKMTRRLLELLGKILKEIRKTERAYENAQSLLTAREKSDFIGGLCLCHGELTKNPAETTGKRYKKRKFDKPKAETDGTSRLLWSKRKH